MRVEVLGGLERRRRWSQDDKARIAEETLAPGAKVTEVARRNGVAASVVFTWRRQARTAAQVERWICCQRISTSSLTRSACRNAMRISSRSRTGLRLSPAVVSSLSISASVRYSRWR
jgi:transposase-like protein